MKWKPIDPARCLSCGKGGGVLKPIYGDKLPGCCPACWPAARQGVLKLIPQGSGVAFDTPIPYKLTAKAGAR